MKVWVVCASVNELQNLHRFYPMLKRSECRITIVDEGDEKIRASNAILLDDLRYEFYGPKERAAWFQARFPGKVEYSMVIPERCHAETSFGFLIALEQGAEIVIEVDDDVFPFKDYSLVDSHVKNLSNSGDRTVSSPSKWYNTLLNLVFDRNVGVFPRGHPYSPDARSGLCHVSNESGETVLNMGLWAGDPDLDASTILQNGGLNGKSPIKSTGLRHDRILVGKETYFAVCSMNTAFRKMVIPCFYQLYMKQLGIDRFDDIWSGIFLKKIADHLGDKISLGAPLVFHDKRPRSIFKDLRAELEGMIINETLWRIIDSLELNGKNYYDCYASLIDGLTRQVSSFNDKLHRDFMDIQVKKMRLWLEIVDKVA